jgi:uncharacterized membrane protein/thiol-disulfide isomerase/thioredoxin
MFVHYSGIITQNGLLRNLRNLFAKSGSQMLKHVAVLLICSLLALTPVAAFAEKSVVYAVLFFSPLCSHCRLVIDNDLPLWQQEFGDQFKLVMVDVTTEQGRALYRAVPEAPGGVPVLVIGHVVLLGDSDISTRLPTLIRDGLAKGGVELPPIPGLREAFAGELAEPSLIRRLAADPIANGLTIGVLLALVVSAGAVLFAWVRARHRTCVRGKPVWLPALIASLLATGLAGTLLHKSPGASILLTGSITFALMIETAGIAVGWHNAPKDGSWLSKLIPLSALVGLAVAAYLSSVEVTQNEAFCGLVGDCNAVQQSSYARLFGVLPVGILGMGGYIGILLVWFVGRLGSVRVAALAQTGLRAMVMGGVIFSIYLTFLEPFVIGATCIWCLTSAVIMLLLLWLTGFDTQRAVAFNPGQAAILDR